TIGPLNSNNSINFIKLINSISHNNSNNIIIKPVYGADCENVTLISSNNDLNKYFDTYFVDINNDSNTDSEFLIQEFITGDSFSVSLIVVNGKSVPLSLNKQFIDFNNVTGNYSYLGGEITHNHPFEEIAFNVAKSAVDAIDGLNGFVGVDLIINNDNCHECFNNINKSDVYVIEINSRFTTPYVGLRNALNFNIIDAIINENDINDLDNNINNSNNNNINSNNNTISLNINRKVNFKKDINNNDLKIDFISNSNDDTNNANTNGDNTNNTDINDNDININNNSNNYNNNYNNN
ncbi:MAG: ATP-grasp domain-containing protein, partial [Methanobacteriaceae archaeon]